MKRILSILLCAAMLVGMVSFSASADSNGDYSYHYTEADIGNTYATNATVEYDANYQALKITPNSVGEVNLTLDISKLYFRMTAEIDEPTQDMALAAWFPTTSCYDNCSFDVFIDNMETLTTASCGYAFDIFALSIATDTSGGEPNRMEIYFTPSSCDSFYIYGAARIFNGSPDFNQYIDELVEQANGSLNTESINTDKLDSYDVDTYTKSYWDADVIYNESFIPLTEQDGTLEPIQLMYGIDRAVSVRNSYLDTEYTYGVDYTVEDGKLVILPGGAIHIYNYADVYRNTTQSESYRKTVDGRYAYCGQVAMYEVGYYNITYTTSGTWNGPVPESKAYLLQNVMTKLENGENVKLMSVGDSIAAGANASSDIQLTPTSPKGVAPYADVWCDMAAKKVQLMYPEATVESTTVAQGGATASYCAEHIAEITAYAPDCIFIEFGTNDCMQGDSPATFISTIQQAIAAIKENVPTCDIVLVAPIISNPLFFDSNNFYAYADALYALEESGVAVANVTSELQYMLTRKDYMDMTGDFLCHPADFVGRVYAQTIAGTLTDSTVDEYKADLERRLQAYRYADEFSEANLETVNGYITNGKATITQAADRSAAMSAYLAAAQQIDAVETIADEEANANIDCRSLIFNKLRSYDTVSTESNGIAASYSDSEKALLLTITSARSAYQKLDYGVSSTAVSAESCKYAVLTLKAPLTNSSRAQTTSIALSVNDTLLAAKTASLTLDGKYHSYIVDLTALEGMSGTVDGIKITPFTSCQSNDKLYISSICFTESYTDAYDLKLERDYAANNDTTTPVTYLFSDSSYVEDNLYGVYHNGIFCGDVDGNGALSAKDALKLRKYLSAEDTVIENPAALDVNNDGEVNTADALTLTKTLTKILAETHTESYREAAVEYNAANDSAKITANVDNPSVTVGMVPLHNPDTGLGMTDEDYYYTDAYKYIATCAKSADGSPLSVTVTMKTQDGGTQSETITLNGEGSFSAETTKHTKLTGRIDSVTFTFNVARGEIVYLDSFVLSPTRSISENAETVRVGAANLINN